MGTGQVCLTADETHLPYPVPGGDRLQPPPLRPAGPVTQVLGHLVLGCSPPACWALWVTSAPPAPRLAFTAPRTGSAGTCTFQLLYQPLNEPQHFSPSFSHVQRAPRGPVSEAHAKPGKVPLPTLPSVPHTSLLPGHPPEGLYLLTAPLSWVLDVHDLIISLRVL